MKILKELSLAAIMTGSGFITGCADTEDKLTPEQQVQRQQTQEKLERMTIRRVIQGERILGLRDGAYTINIPAEDWEGQKDLNLFLIKEWGGAANGGPSIGVTTIPNEYFEAEPDAAPQPEGP